MVEFVPAARRCLVTLFFVALLAGCSGTLSRIGIGGSEATAPSENVETAKAAEPGSTDQVDIRRYYGSGYCPIIEIRDGTQAIRNYVKPKEPSPESVIWQASLGETARECREDPNGTMTIRIGVSGRVLAGPKGGPSEVTVPIRVAVVKYQESVLKSELYKEKVAIGPDLSTVFRRVYTVEVPSPGEDRDYLIYIGFDGGK